MNRSRENRGSALIITIVMVLALSALAAALLTEVFFHSDRATQVMQEDEAMTIARAGLEKVRTQLYLYRTTAAWDSSLSTASDRWNSILRFNAGDGTTVGGNGVNRVFSTDLELIKANFETMLASSTFTAYAAGNQAAGTGIGAITPNKADPDVSFCQNKPFRTGGYHVQVRDNVETDGNLNVDTDRALIITITATLPGGIQRQLEATVVFDPPVFLPGQALLAEGDILLSGSIGVTGQFGGAATNNNLEVNNGAVNVQGALQAVGSISLPSGWAPGGGAISPAPNQPIPTMNPQQFQTYADYFMNANGTVTNAAGALLPMTGNGNSADWNGFSFNANNGWSFSGNSSPPAGNYFVGADLSISGFGNSSGMTASFFVQGNVQITGNGTFTPNLGDVALIASGTLDMQGTPGTTVNGFWGAAGTASLGGNVTVNGTIVTSANPVSGNALTVNGSAIVNYDEQIDSLIEVASQVNIRTIRRLK